MTTQTTQQQENQEPTEAEIAAMMAKSQFRPDPSQVQSGYYDAQGAELDSVPEMDFGPVAQPAPAEVASMAEAREMTAADVQGLLGAPAEPLQASMSPEDDDEDEDEDEDDLEDEADDEEDDEDDEDFGKSASAVLADFVGSGAGRVRKSAPGQGGMPEVGVPAGMPTQQRPSDGGGDAAFTQRVSMAEPNPAAGLDPQLLSVVLSELRIQDGDVDLERMVGGMSWETPSVKKSSPDVEGYARWMRLQEVAARVGVNLNRQVGVGVAPPEPMHKAEPALSLDAYIEKSLSSGNNWTPMDVSAGMRYGAPMLRHKTCGACGQLTKSYLTVCDVCGVDLAGGQQLGG